MMHGSKQYLRPAGAGIMSISVSIVEDDAKVRDSLARLIDSSPGYRCVSQHASGENALQEIPGIGPNVTLMDINLKGMNGVECVRRLKPLVPGTQIIMLTVYARIRSIFLTRWPPAPPVTC